jgi:hypothetical protein
MTGWRDCGSPYRTGSAKSRQGNSMGNELALDFNVICLLNLGLFFASLVTALAGPVLAGVSCVGLWLYGLRKGRARMRRAQAEALEAEAVAEAEAAAAEAIIAEAEAVIAAARLRLLGGAGS